MARQTTRPFRHIADIENAKILPPVSRGFSHLARKVIGVDEECRGKQNRMEIDVRELCVERGPDACSQTRDWVRALPTSLPPPMAADVELLTHELITNAFRHSDTQRAWITMLMLPQSVLVQVTDEGHGRPRIRPLTPFGDSGRGLRWVSALSAVWGVHRGVTTGVWFQVNRNAA